MTEQIGNKVIVDEQGHVQHETSEETLGKLLMDSAALCELTGMLESLEEGCILRRAKTGWEFYPSDTEINTEEATWDGDTLAGMLNDMWREGHCEDEEVYDEYPDDDEEPEYGDDDDWYPDVPF